MPLFHAFLERRFFYRWTLPAPFVAVVAFIAIAATPVAPPLAIIALLVPTAIEILPAVARLISAHILARFLADIEIVETIVEIIVPGTEPLLLLLLTGAIVGQLA